MYRIRRFGVVRTATLVAVAYAIVFAIVFLPIALIGLAAFQGNAALAFGGILAVGVVLLVIYPLAIWVFTALACLVYNLAARLVGGIEVEIERPQAAWPPPGSQPGWAQPPDAQGPWSQPGNRR